MDSRIAQFDVMPALIRELEDTVYLSTGSRLAASKQPVDTCLLRCCAIAILVCDDAVTAKDASHQLSIITRCMTRWMFPADIKTKRKTGLDFDRLLQIVGCVRTLLHTRWQALSGRKRKSWARQRLQCVHPNLAAALFRPSALPPLDRQSLAQFLGAQLRCWALSSCKHGLLYVLCSPQAVLPGQYEL